MILAISDGIRRGQRLSNWEAPSAVCAVAFCPYYSIFNYIILGGNRGDLIEIDGRKLSAGYIHDK